MFNKLTTLARRGARTVMQTVGVNPVPPLCESVLVWAPGQGWYTTRLHDAFTLNFDVPTSLHHYPHLHCQFEVNSNLGFPAQYLVEIPNATVKTSSGFITTADGAYLAEGHWRVGNVTGHPVFRKEWSINQRRQLSGDWYCAMGHWGANYNHWLWDELPRLLTALPHLPAETQFLVPEPLAEIQRDSLIALGIEADRLLPQAYDCESVVERLWFATPLGHSEWAATAPDVAMQLREKFLKAYGLEAGRADRRLYISRSQASYRRLLNEEELLPILKQHRFEVIRPETLSFADQVRTFAQASVIMGVHGAGLTNMLFAPAEAKIIELHGPKVTRTHYWMMANSLKQNYQCIVGTGVDKDISDNHEPNLRLNKTHVIEILSNLD